MKKLFAIFLSLFLLAFQTQAKIKLPGALTDNMVLQQKTLANIWGWTDAGKTVTVTPSWDGKNYTAKADAQGRWTVKVATPEAGGPFSIDISDGQAVTLGNVLIGEVWVCSGQSNMEMRMRGNMGQPIDNSLKTIMESGKYRDRIRVITIPRHSAAEPQQDIKEGARWEMPSAATTPGFSAAAYFFAVNITESLGVPVGLILTSWGGSAIEAWMRDGDLASIAGVDMAAVRANTKENGAVSRLYNGMILPVKDFTAKGFLWYQGESNRKGYAVYPQQQAAMVAHWRDIWGDASMPFYFVQIAPYMYEDSRGTDVGLITEAQLRSLDLIPHSGMASTSDIGDEFCIHPPQKDVVGLRLSLLALAKTYGVEGLPAHGPVYRDVKFENGKAVVSFDYSRSLSPENRNVAGFEIAGKDRIFHPAQAAIVKGRPEVTVVSKEVPDPVAVRYCFRNFMPAGLTDTYGIAAYPFRTDDWDN